MQFLDDADHDLGRLLVLCRDHTLIVNTARVTQLCGVDATSVE
ncbi:hypothetical protein [Cellulosimicrobium composti]|nr:hypothetical protein [Cellulosimicrobium composti]